MNQKRTVNKLNANTFKEEQSIYLNELRGGLLTVYVFQAKIWQSTNISKDGHV